MSNPQKTGENLMMANFTYEDAIKTLLLFFDKEGLEYLDNDDINKVKDQLASQPEEKDSPIDNLFKALYQKKDNSDFSDNYIGSDAFKEKYRTTISNAIWYNKAPQKTQPKDSQDVSILSADDLLDLFSTLSWAVPEAGPFLSAGCTIIKHMKDNMEKKQKLYDEEIKQKEENKEAKNPTTDGYTLVVKQIKDYMQKHEISTENRILFADLESLKDSILKIGLSPIGSGDGETDIPLKLKKEINELRQDTLLNRDFWLRQIGKVFDIVESSELQEIVFANSKFLDNEMEVNLYSKPTFKMVVFEAFIHVSLTIVTALLAYAYLYVLPDEAFTNKDWDKSKFDIDKALKTTDKNNLDGQNRKTASYALRLLHQQLERYIERLKDASDIWRQIFERLKKVSFDCEQPAERNSLWYLEKSKQLTVNIVHLKENDLSTGSINDLFTSRTCEDNQIVCLDDTLINSDGHDLFLEGYFNFNTKLSITWETGSLDELKDKVAQSWPNYLFEAEQFVVSPQTFLSSSELGNDVTKLLYSKLSTVREVIYPRRKDQEGNGDVPRCDVFWTEGFEKEKISSFRNACLPGFLQTQQGRDIIAWLALILNQYSEEYHFTLNLETQLSTVHIANRLLKVYENFNDGVKRIFAEADT
jgi:hypothetical protein